MVFSRENSTVSTKKKMKKVEKLLLKECRKYFDFKHSDFFGYVDTHKYADVIAINLVLLNKRSKK